MWDLSDLPLALIMEEILEWEKRPGQETKQGKDERDSTSGKDKDE